MYVNSVGGVDYFNAGFGRKIDPRKDRVYIDPRTGEYTTWKPGIRPEKKNDSVLKKLIVWGGLGLTAYLFRGKIKNGIKAIAKMIGPKAEQLLHSANEAVQPAIKFGKNLIKTGLETIEKYIPKKHK